VTPESATQSTRVSLRFLKRPTARGSVTARLKIGLRPGAVGALMSVEAHALAVRIGETTESF
jgi:hypothetical protein